ncbi:MAG: RNase adapter RapZ [Candidatus Palauibacterales bacterium]|nr:RNase adapter RapZ [Candidatus Palauibacterales bacterium]
MRPAQPDIASPPIMQERLIALYREHFGQAPSAVLELAGDGSNRAYRRLLGSGNPPVVGVMGPDHEENRAFLAFTRAFRSIDLPVPRLHAEDEAGDVYLLEDLGDTTLFDALDEARLAAGGAFPDTLVPVYREVVRWLPKFQVRGGKVVDYAVAYPREAFDRQSILWDLNYFKYHFLKLAHVPFSEARLEHDFETLIAFLLEADREHFLYRDFQSRNVMLQDGAPRFIDYQGGRRGALAYDVASLLYDAKADLPAEVRDELLDSYLEALALEVPVERRSFQLQYRGYVLVRIMQALGAYGYRGFFERKPRFLRSVPFAARNLRSLLEEGLPVRVPELERVFAHIASAWSGPDALPSQPGLTLHVFSFSYRRGYPEPVDGHGGGFVFDCRAVPNPGREPEYRSQTGLDPAVIEFIEKDQATASFWAAVRDLSEAHVTEYLRRGFESLTVSFGCTGGQHRSVYFAERLAKHVEGVFPDVRVRVHHREQVHWPARDGGQS